LNTPPSDEEVDGLLGRALRQIPNEDCGKAGVRPGRGLGDVTEGATHRARVLRVQLRLQAVQHLKARRPKRRQVVAVGMHVLADESSSAACVLESRLPSEMRLEWVKHRDHQPAAGLEHAGEFRRPGTEVVEVG
jgi:hypothetical protein